MSGTTELAAFYSVLEESARLLDAPCSRDQVWPILTAYEDVFAQSAIAFRVETGVRHAGEMDCRFTMIPPDVDPYARALSHGLTTRTGHPAGALLADVSRRCPIDNYGVNFGLADGFRKTWQFFPPGDMQHVSTLAGIPSMPPSLAANAGFFARRGLDDKVCLTGIDYQHKTANVYFGQPPAESLEPAAITSMHREIGLPDPSERMLRLCRQAVAVYVTLSWDSPRIERVSFTLMTPDPMALAGHLEPEIEKLIGIAPASDSGAGRRFMYYVATSASGEYDKLLSFYRWNPRVVNLVLSS
jgi:Aromatic prenyltransferase Orf2